MIILPVPVDGEVAPGVKLGDLIIDACEKAEVVLEDDDVVIVTQKIVSKAEGRLVEVGADPQARRQVAEREARRVLRRRGTLLITETQHGFVCANAGVDSSNVSDGSVCLLPLDPDASARRIRSRIKALSSVDLAVIISDTFGRAWRSGQTNVAIGLAGMRPLRSYFGVEDTFGSVMHATNIAVADQLAGAAELVMGKTEGIPLAVAKGSGVKRGRGSAKELVRPARDDLFR